MNQQILENGDISISFIPDTEALEAACLTFSMLTMNQPDKLRNMCYLMFISTLPHEDKRYILKSLKNAMNITVNGHAEDLANLVKNTSGKQTMYVDILLSQGSVEIYQK